MRLINLLPKPRQSEIRYEVVFKTLLKVFVVSLISFAAVFMVQLGTKFYLQAENGSMQAQIDELRNQVNKQDNAVIKKKIQALNGEIGDFNTLAGNAPKWSQVIEAFAPLPPAGVRIGSLNVDAPRKMITISGTSPTRELAILLHDIILADEEHFINIDYPLENILKAVDVSFHFTFNFKDTLIK